jgi:curved DNA-binding protein CbpA
MQWHPDRHTASDKHMQKVGGHSIQAGSTSLPLVIWASGAGVAASAAPPLTACAAPLQVAADRFAQLMQAYNVLKDEETRSLYDRGLYYEETTVL